MQQDEEQTQQILQDMASSKLKDIAEEIVEKNTLASLEKRALHGDPEAQYYLGRFYEHGPQPMRSIIRAVDFYSLSAKQHHPQAQYYLGQCYEEGRGIDQDRKKAIRLYKASKKQGNLDAAMKLAERFLTGSGMAIERGFRAFRKLAKAGNAAAQNEWVIGICRDGK